MAISDRLATRIFVMAKEEGSGQGGMGAQQ
jgi:hypothetical protein